MTDREKLLALLVQGCREERGEDDIPCCEESFCKDNHTSCYGETADYLLAHGVVVREKGVIMNPVRKYHAYYSDDYCPVCGKQQKTAKRSMEKPWYCERCGQKLGWDGFNQFPEPPMRKGENG